jgi:hypothetical protein
VIEKGISAGDKVIVEGGEKVRPGMAVNPQPAPPEEAPAAAEKGSTTGSGS